MKKLTFLALFLGLIVGCDSSYEDTVIATANPPEFEIFNDTENPVFYIIVETETSYLIDLSDPCKDNLQPKLPAHSTITIPYSEIIGMNEKAESAWFMWTDCKGNGDSENIQLFKS